jgi:hypothetical protein
MKTDSILEKTVDHGKTRPPRRQIPGCWCNNPTFGLEFYRKEGGNYSVVSNLGDTRKIIVIARSEATWQPIVYSNSFR